MWLNFELPEPRSFERIRKLFETMAQVLLGHSISLVRREYREEPDANFGAHPCFVARWTDGKVTFDESVLSGSGNPRDGYGYDVTLTLTLPGTTLKASGGGYDWVPTSLSVKSSSSGRDWLRLRETLRLELGVENDRCMQPHIVAEVLKALSAEGEETSALALARECFARVGHAAYGRDEIVSWLAQHDPSSGGATMRVKEAPAVLEGWLELERAGDSSLAPVFARLCPFELARWKGAALPPASWFAHPAWPFERATSPETSWRTVHLPAPYVTQSFATQLSRAMTGFEWGSDWQDVTGEALPHGPDGWHWSVSRRARYPDGAAAPRVNVTIQGVRREPRQWELPWQQLFEVPFLEMLRWSWIDGPATGDAALIVERSLPQKGPNPTIAAIAFTTIGSSEFRARVEVEVARITRLRWYPVTASESLEPWKLGAPRFDDAASALAATIPPEQLARAHELLACRCAQPAIGYCEHRVELLNYSREDRFGSPRNRARSAAWSTAFEATGDRPDHQAVLRYVREVHEELIVAAEFID